MKYKILVLLVILAGVLGSWKPASAANTTVFCEVRNMCSVRGGVRGKAINWNNLYYRLSVASNTSWSIFDILTRYTPYAGDVRDIYEFVTCTDLGSGRKLSLDEKNITGIFMLVGGASASSVRQAMFFETQISRIMRSEIPADILNKWAPFVRGQLKYHFEKHVVADKLEWTVEEFTNKGVYLLQNYYRQPKLFRFEKKMINNNMEEGFKITGTGYFGIYNKKGELVTFGLDK